jgi:hypothetical protein
MIMKSGLLQFIKRAFARDTDVHPVEQGMARRYVKQRLVAVFPQLRNNPTALDRAYQTLGLTAREGAEDGEAGIVYEMQLPFGDS